MESWLFDETDLLLVSALQVAPRASWSDLGYALGFDPVTLSNHWRRLQSEGLAWTTCYPDLTSSWRGSLAFVELDCVPGTREAVALELSKDPGTCSIEYTTGRRDLFLTVMMGGLGEIDTYVAERVGVIPGVSSTRTHHIRRVFSEGSTWRLGRLSPVQERRLQQIQQRESTDGPPRPPTATEIKLMVQLGGDGRRSASSIAAELGLSVSTVSRGIDRVLANKRGTLRCDIAHDASPWNVIAVVWLSAPHHQVPTIAASMIRVPQVRLCCTLASTANLMVQVWMRSLDEMDTIEDALVTDFPGARVLDRWVVSRIPKRMGHLMDRKGRRISYVPIPFAAKNDGSRWVTKTDNILPPAAR
jgi:DNA-binding Lrp family transcriptional regulator